MNRKAPQTHTVQADVVTHHTVADVLHSVELWVDLTLERRRGICSSLRLLARAGGVPPEAFVFTVEAVQSSLMDCSPVALGVGRGRFRNTVSDVRFVLRRLDLVDAEPDALAPAWTDLLGRWGCRARAPFARFAKFATLRAIDPAQVDDQSYAAFRAWVTARALIARPEKVAASFRRAWNRAVQTEPGWPQTLLTLPRRSGDFALPLSAFPVPFVVDVDAFLVRLATNDRAAVFDLEAVAAVPESSAGLKALTGCGIARFGGGRVHRAMRASTIQTRRDHLRWAASAAVASGVPIAELTSLGALFAPPTRPREILRFFYNRAGAKPSTMGQHVGQILRMVAMIHLDLPAERIAQIKAWQRPVAVAYADMTERNDLLLHKLMEPVTYARLLRLPHVAIEEATRRLDDDTEFAVSLAQRALAVQILLTMPPLRLANLIGLRIDTHLQRNDPSRARVTHLSVPAAETKNGRAILRPIGGNMTEMLDLWIKRFRPHRAAGGNRFLFPGLDDRSITAQGMRDGIRAITREAIGVAVNPHLFRHFNAVDFLRRHPGQYVTVQKQLNHGSLETTLRHYVGTETDAAHALFDAHNDERQARIRAPRPMPKAAPKVRGRA